MKKPSILGLNAFYPRGYEGGGPMHALAGMVSLLKGDVDFVVVTGGDCRVGIISIKNREMHARHWWQLSRGARIAIGEFVAYVYALVVFPLV
jgi:hypothetical protein